MPRIKPLYLIAGTAVPILVIVISVALVNFRGRPAAPSPEFEAEPAAGESKRDDPKAPKEKEVTTKLAIVSDRFDRMAGLLDKLGGSYGYELIEEERLRDPKACAQFSSIFLTCDEPPDGAEDPKLSEGLREYVSEGGTLYASDLRFDVLAAAFPECVDRTSVAQGVRQKIRAEVASAELRDVVGAEILLSFRLDGWRPAAFRGDEMTTLVKGRLRTTAGVMVEAPLLVKFPVGKGTVYFTSFHNEDNNSEAEIKLLKHLALKTVTAGMESRESALLTDEGFTPCAVAALGATAGAPPVTRVYQHEKAGALRFRLAFEGSKAKMRLDVVSPSGERTSKQGDSPLVIDLPKAASGRWEYTTAVEHVPHPDFPTVLLVGRSGGPVVERMNPALPAAPGGNVRFEEIFLGNKNKSGAGRLPRIAVSDPAEYDDMGKMLNTLGEGYHFKTLNLDEMLKPDALEPFDLLFLTCRGTPASWILAYLDKAERVGHVTADPAKTAKFGENVRQFVQRGGTLYASDLCQYLLMDVFPTRYPGIALDESLLPELDRVERRWIEAKAPLRKIGTVSDVLRDAGLSPALKKRHSRLVAGIEGSGLIEGMLSRWDEAEVAKNIRDWLAGIGLPAIDSDVEVIKRALVDWEKAITKGYRASDARTRAQNRGHVALAERQLERLRKQLSMDDRGVKDQTVNAEVVEPGLRELLGSSLSLTFNGNGWIPANFPGDDVIVLLRGEYKPLSGGLTKAPLLVKFPEGQGTVIFTSFHNEAQNSQQEEALLRYLVFTAVTARAEALTDQVMLRGGFTPVKRNQLNHAAGNASVTKSYKSTDSGPVRFGLTFTGAGAKLRLTLVSPDKQEYKQEVDDSVVIEATGAPAGEWLYTVESLKVPYDNFPYSVSVGKGGGPKK